MKNYQKLTLIAALAATWIGAMPMRASAQTGGQSGDISNTNIPTLNLQDADVRDALRALFKNVGVSYEISSDVQGTVTVSFKDIKFETALRNILDQVKATYRIEGGVYQIIKREEVVTTGEQNAGANTITQKKEPRRIYIKSADPAAIIRLLAGMGVSTKSVIPEITTVSNGQLLGGGGGTGGGGGFGGGGGGFGGGSGGMGGGGGFGGGGGIGGGGGFGGGGGGRTGGGGMGGF